MKKSVLILSLIFIAFVANATILTVCNHSLYPAQYTNIADAIAAASPGDTIYVMPSGTSYGDITVSVPSITLIGAGFEPNTQYGWKTEVHNVSFNDVSDNSVLKGFYTRTIYSSGTPTNILLENNNIYSVSSSDQGWIIKGNIIRFDIYVSSTDIIISNNLLVYGGSTSIINRANSSTLILNNVFYKSGGNTFYDCNYSTISNNLFYFTDASEGQLIDAGCTYCNFSNNIAFANNFVN